jgi:Spy/CpxP family protein refolding chaperone
VDDTGLPQAEREKLQARRAAAERLGMPGPAAPAAAATAAPATPTVATASSTAKTPPPPPPRGGVDAAKSAEGLKRALEAQKLTDSMADQLKAASRPRQ